MTRRDVLIPPVVITGLFFAAVLAMPSLRVSAAGYRPIADDKNATTAPEKPKDSDGPALRTVRPPTDKEKKDASAAIEGQLKAFKANDWEAATHFQHSSLRKAFRSVQEFRAAIRQGYPQFANYKSVTFGDARCSTNGDRYEVRVSVTGVDGVSIKATYALEREEGEYRIAGVDVDRKRIEDDQDVA
jgi:hypothetical protein